MEKSWKIAKIQNFMEICFARKKVMEKSWKSVVQIKWVERMAARGGGGHYSVTLIFLNSD